MVEEKLIYCSECDDEKRRIESSGLYQVIDCLPEPGQEGMPEAKRLCVIRWELRSAGGNAAAAGVAAEDEVESRLIYCADCASEKASIQSSGLFEVVDCKEEPGQGAKPEKHRLCTISWRRKG